MTYAIELFFNKATNINYSVDKSHSRNNAINKKMIPLENMSDICNNTPKTTIASQSPGCQEGSKVQDAKKSPKSKKR